MGFLPSMSMIKYIKTNIQKQFTVKKTKLTEKDMESLSYL